MTVAAVSPSSPVIERRPRSRSFGAGTPTFSSDLAKLKAACSNECSIVHTYREAIVIASTFDVLGASSPLCRKLRLEEEADWIEFISKSGAVTGDSGDENSGVSINLEKFLRHCFDIAFKMPPSPSTKAKLVRANGGESPTPLQV